MGDETLTYDEVRAVAHEIFSIEKRMRNIRTMLMMAAFVLLGAVVFVVVMYTVFDQAEKAKVEPSGVQSALVSKKKNEILQTAQSMADVDAADLIDYTRDTKDA